MQPAEQAARPILGPAGGKARLSVAAGVSSLDRSTLASLGLAATTCQGAGQEDIAAGL